MVEVPPLTKADLAATAVAMTALADREKDVVAADASCNPPGFETTQICDMIFFFLVLLLVVMC